MCQKTSIELRFNLNIPLISLENYFKKKLTVTFQKFDLSPKTIDPLEDTLEIYCTVDELRQRIEALEPDVKLEPDLRDELVDKLGDKADFNDTLKIELNKNTLHFNFIEGKRDVLQVS